MIGESGIVLYVGKGRRLRTRLLSYFRARGRRNKQARILRHAFRIEWDYTPNEFSALLGELRLIKQYRPAFNATYVDDEWPRAWIAITGGPVPAIRILPRTDDPSAVALFGPFRRVSWVREAVRALADVMQVRDCDIENPSNAKRLALSFATTRTRNGSQQASTSRTRAPGCLRYELGTCAGPCVGAGDERTYLENLERIRQFLDGKSNHPVEQLHLHMQTAAANMEFERAAVLRDRLEVVTWLGKRVRQFRADADRLSFRYHAASFDGSERVYLIRRGTLRAEVSAPSTEEERVALEAMTERIYNGPDPRGADIPLHDLDEFHLVASWFRRNPGELAHCVKAGTNGEH
jgi:excinuclease ABC subunit C